MSNDIKSIINIIEQLKQAKIHYSVSCNRDEALSIEVAVPGERWEIDFLTDGSVDIEVFKSDGTIYDKSKLSELFEKFSD